MPRRIFLTLGVILALAASAITAHAGTYFAAKLEGAQETPPTPSPGTGEGWAVLNNAETMLTVGGTYGGLTGPPTAMHIHRAARGVAGGVAVPLVLGLGTFSGVWVIPAADVALLKTGGLYLNIHTPAFGGGEIRGQLTTRTYSTVADGVEEVPPNAAPGLAFCTAMLSPDEGMLRLHIDADGLSGPMTGAHIHRGAPGVGGPVVIPIPLFPHILDVDVPFPAADLANLEGGIMYVNLHTAALPGGEIRGQLRLGSCYDARLDGAQEVPPNASPGMGRGQLWLNGAETEAHIYEEAAGLLGPITASHIHRAPPGVAGGVVQPLGAFATHILNQWAIPPANVADLKAGLLYFNVHTTVFGGGEIRGQIGLTPTSVGEMELPASTASLGLAFQPNPTREGGAVRFSLARDQDVSLRIFDVTGRLVRGIEGVEGRLGENTIVWDGVDSAGGHVPSGLYFAVLQTSEGVGTARIAVIR